MEIQDLTRPEVAKQLIDDLGGSTVVAVLLGYQKEDRRKGGHRVSSWCGNGMPSAMAMQSGKMLIKQWRRALRKSAK
jgi:hypothetical protein